MITVFKYEFEIKLGVEQVIDLPRYYEVIHVEMQGDVPTMWAFVDTEEEVVPQRFRVFATGEEIPDMGDALKGDAYLHVGTIFNWVFVFHVFHIEYIELPEWMEDRANET